MSQEPPAETPEDEAEAAVRVQTDGHLSGGVQLTLQLHRAAEGPHCIMGHLEASRQGGGVKTEAQPRDRGREAGLT